MSVQLTIKNCRQCPHLRQEKVYTADSWEEVTGWYCSKKKGRQITELDWNYKPPPIPKWCPLRKKS